MSSDAIVKIIDAGGEVVYEGPGLICMSSSMSMDPFDTRDKYFVQVNEKLAYNLKTADDSEAPEDSEVPDMVNKPPHYTRDGAMETIEEMELVFGIYKTMNFCELNAWKYRARALFKNGEEDLKKSDWYLNKLKELREKNDKINEDKYKRQFARIYQETDDAKKI